MGGALGITNTLYSPFNNFLFSANGIFVPEDERVRKIHDCYDIILVNQLIN